MKLLFLLMLLPFMCLGQSHDVFWSWISDLNNYSDEELVSYFEYIDERPSQNEISVNHQNGYFFQIDSRSFTINKERNQHIFSGNQGDTYSLMVSRIDLSSLLDMIDDMTKNYYNQTNSGSYAIVYDGNNQIASGSLDISSVNGVQIDFINVAQNIDFTNKNVSLKINLFQDGDIENSISSEISLRSEGNYGYNWLLRLSGTTKAFESFISEMPIASRRITCEKEGRHAFLEFQLGKRSDIKARGVFDTGASLLTVTESEYSRLLENGDAQDIGTRTFSTANGNVDSKILIINEVTIQGIVFYDIEASVNNLDENLIGQSIFKNRKWLYNNSDGVITVD